MQDAGQDKSEKLKWMLNETSPVAGNDKDEYSSPYGDVTELNSCRLIIDCVGTETLKEIGENAIRLLDTSVAIYEANGDYAFGMFSSGWCRFMDSASRELCKTDDNREALSCGKWLCHESCWNDCAKRTIETGKSTDIACVGGIRLYSEPIYAGQKVIGAINIGYGEPPKDPAQLKDLAEAFRVEPEKLKEIGESYQSRPTFIIDTTKKLLGAFAGLIGQIVEKAEAEEKRIESERNLQLTLDATADGIWSWNFKTNELYFSPKYYKMLGYEPNEFPADFDNWLNLIHPDDKENALNVAKKFLKTKPDLYKNEFRVKTKNCDYLWVKTIAKVVERDENGDAVYMIGNHEDITERKLALDKIIEERERFDLAIQAVNEGLWDWNLKTNEIYYSPVWKKILGYEDHEIKNEFSEWERLTDPKDVKISWEILNEVLAGKRKSFENEFKMLHKDGHKVDILARANVFFDENGKGERCIGTHVDITERKRMEETLRSNEAKFRLAFKTSPDSINLNRLKDGVYIDINNGFTKIMGYSPEEIVGRSSLELNIWKNELDRKRLVDGLNEKGHVENLEAEFLSKNGDIKYGLMSAAVMEVGGEKVILSITRDITERKQIEAEHEKLQIQLNQAQKMESIGRLAGGVAHDFNNMLGIILGHADMILEEMAPDQPFHANLTEIKKAGERSAELTRQLLAFARKQTVAPKVLDLNKTMESMLKMLHRLIGEDIDMAWIPGEKVWPIKIDPAQIDQILVNLCINARDAIAGVGKVTIETGNIVFSKEYCNERVGFVPGEYTLLAVSDNGCGMNSETLKNIFEPFFTTKESNKGTGLGLATVYGVVRQNNGFINVYSEPNQGTTFRIYLPRHRVKGALLPDREEIRPAARGHETILLVEDEPAILKMTTMMLEQIGYKVLAAGTPGEAIAFAREHAGDIHLLITDVVMPEMNGRDLAKNLLSLYPSLKLLFMSGYTANVIAHNGVLDEGVQFIQKPFFKADLSIKVRAALEHK
jgi:PAS domain S-box-containing protein